MTIQNALSKAVNKWVWTFILGLGILIYGTFSRLTSPLIPITVLLLWFGGLVGVGIDTYRYRR